MVTVALAARALDFRRVATRAEWFLVGYLAGLAVAELLVASGFPIAGIATHVVLIICLSVHGAFADVRDRQVLVALSLAPLIRVVSLSIPLAGIPLVYSLALASLPLFASAARTIQVLGLNPRELGLRRGTI